MQKIRTPISLNGGLFHTRRHLQVQLEAKRINLDDETDKGFIIFEHLEAVGILEIRRKADDRTQFEYEWHNTTMISVTG